MESAQRRPMGRQSSSQYNGQTLLLLSLCLGGLLLGVVGCTNDSSEDATEPVPDAGPVLVDSALGDAGSMLDSSIDADLMDAQAVDAVTGDVAMPEDEDRSDEVYQRDRLLEVSIELAEDDWNALRLQRRRGLEILGPECSLPPSPYTWFPGQVTVNGEVFENVGVRKKGFFGSLSETRPSFKIKFDKYEDDLTYLDMKRLTLNNSRQDPSFVRQCLAYDLFRAAGIKAPRCNFAHVVLNGMDMGVYVNVESLKKPFVRRNFEDDEGNLYEGTLSDFREDWTGTIKQKTNEDEPNMEAIDALTAALQVPDEELLDAVSAVIDLDAFLTFWAVEIMVAHWDGYSGNTNNFHFYDDPTSGKLHFIPWGTDGTFQQPLLFFEDRRPAPRSVNAAGLLARRLYLHPQGRALYLAKLIALLDIHWNVDRLEASIEEMVDVFGLAVLPERANAFYSALDDVLSFLPEQERRIRQEIAEGPVTWSVPLRGGLCQEQIGSAQGTFETTWGSFPADDTFRTGSGMAAIDLRGRNLDIGRVGGAIGLQEDNPRAAQIIMPLIVNEDDIYFFAFVMPLAEVRPGAEFDVSAPQNFCVLNQFDPRTRRVRQLATCQSGTLVIEEARVEQGAPVRARFDVGLWGRGR